MVERETILEVQDAKRQFGHRLALAGISFALSAGEIFVLIGPNGAGKTTLVRAIAGQLPLDSGHIRILGHRVGGDGKTRRLLGLVPQSIALYPHLTARENLEVMGCLSGLSSRSAAAAADDALSWVNLATRANDRTAELSGGMQRRLNIAAGVLHRPKLLLLDEPTVGVDVLAREGIHDLLRQLRQNGMALLLTTHDLDQAAELADRIGILSRGRLVARDTPESVLRRAFGEAKELVVRFAREPDAIGRAFLEAQGFAPGREGRDWRGCVQGGLTEVSVLGTQLSQRGLVIDEVRLREPSLRSVFLRLTGEEFEL